MSRLGINTGNNPNDGQGDPLRVAMGKINSNFLEVYNTFGNGFTLTSYASTAGISTVAQNLTGSPRINVSGILNTGITTTEHLEVRNITSIGVVTATRFVGDGSQLSNVTSTASGVSIYDDNVFLGVARELDFDANIVSTSPDGTQRVRISAQGITSLSQLNVSGVSTFAGIATHTASLFGTQARFTGVVTASSFRGDGSQLTGILPVGAGGTWAVTAAGIHTTKNVGIGTTAKSDIILSVNGLPDKTVSIAGTSVIGYGYENSIRLSKDGFLFPDFYSAVGNDLGLEIPLGVGDFVVNSVLAKFRQTLQVGTIGAGQSACVFIDSRGFMGQGGGQGGPWIGVGAGVSINGSAGGNIQIGVTTSGTGVNIRGNNGSINATGIITAASFIGDGSGLTNVPVSGIATVAQGLIGTPNISVNRVGIASFLSVTGVTTFFNNVHFDYDKYVLIGSNDELQLFHNGSNSYIENTSANNLIVRTTGGSIVFQKLGPENMGVFNTDGSVELYFDNSKKFETTGYGITIFGGLNISGVATATSFSGSGSNLTGLTGASANTYGNGTAVPQIVVDSNGRITSITNVAISTGGVGGGGTSGIYVNDGTLVGFAGTIDFGTGLTVTPLSAGIVTVNAAPSGIVGIATTGTSFFNQLNVSGVSTFANTVTINGSVQFNDNNQLNFGTNTNATLSYNTATSSLRIFANNTDTNLITDNFNVTSNSKNALKTYKDAQVELYFNNAKKIETIGTGVTVTGTTFTNQLSVSGVSTFVGNVGIATTNPTQPFQVGSGSTVVFVDNLGDVGIGTTNATSKLTVVGDGLFTGVVTATRFQSTSAGTPTIDSPNNLNINANTVAISTDTTVGRELRVAGITTVNAGGVRVAGVVTATTFIGALIATGTAPATSNSTGTAGEIRYDANFIYICTATNTWKRVGIATW